jgi:hypothetical protein
LIIALPAITITPLSTIQAATRRSRRHPAKAATARSRAATVQFEDAALNQVENE